MDDVLNNWDKTEATDPPVIQPTIQASEVKKPADSKKEKKSKEATGSRMVSIDLQNINNE